MPDMKGNEGAIAVPLNSFFSLERRQEVLDHPHLADFQMVGHLNKLDAVCIHEWGLAQELVDHIDNDVPAEEKDKAHKAILRAIENGAEIHFQMGDPIGAVIPMIGVKWVNYLSCQVTIFPPGERVTRQREAALATA